MKNKEILLTQLLFLLFVGSLGSLTSFLNLYLEQVVGLTGSQIGFIMFSGAIVTVVMNPIWGFVADKTGKHLLLLKMAFLSAAVVGTFYWASRSFFLIVVVSVLFEALRAPTMPMLEYISTNSCAKHNYSYGKVRVFASIGFLVVATLTGLMVAGLDIELFNRQFGFPGFIGIEFATFGIFIIMSIITLGLLFMFPKGEPVSEDDPKEVVEVDKKAVWALFKNKQFIFIVTLSMIGMMTVEAAYSFAPMHLVTVLGAPESVVSLITVFLVTPELFLLPIGAALVLKYGFKTWYVFSFSTMILRLIIYSFAQTPLLFAMGGMVHVFMIIMHTIGTLAYIRKVVPVHVLGLALAIMASATALSRAIISFSFGWIYENISSFAMFQTATVLLIIGLVMTVKSKDLKVVGDQIRSI